MKRIASYFSILLITLASWACSENDTDATPEINIVSATLNGAAIDDNNQDISTDVRVVLTFDAAIEPSAFEDALSVSSDDGVITPQVTYQNASSQAIITLSLGFSTTYSFGINDQPIGANGQRLSDIFSFQLTTSEDEVIRRQSPCGSASSDCLNVLSFDEENGSQEFTFYSNYPIYEDNAEWEDLTSAIILVHGANRNSDDYFNWMTSTLEKLELDQSTALIAPSFKLQNEAGENEVYWGGNEWREGQNTASGEEISSFTVIDSLLKRLSDKNHFPALEQVVITGHSSGGLFTHVYAAASQLGQTSTNLEVKYLVANSQYFYYPSAERINPTTNELYTPTDCSVYTQWPLGFNNLPPYLQGVTVDEVNNQFVDRSVTYLLGNGNAPDPSLNTSDCDASLLGDTRFARGENFYRYMELKYAEEHNHDKSIVEGIGHDGQAMYQSSEFETLLPGLLESKD